MTNLQLVLSVLILSFLILLGIFLDNGRFNRIDSLLTDMEWDLRSKAPSSKPKACGDR
jgi:hypothetical protein